MLIKKRMTVVSAVLGALTLAVGAAVGVPSVLAIKKTLVDVSAAQTKLDDRYAVNRYLSKARDDIAAKKRLVAPLSDIAIQERRELDFVTAVETAAAKTGVKQRLTLETSQQREISPWQREIPVTISANGNFHRIISFLEELERMPYLLDIGNLSMSPGAAVSASDGPGTVGVELQGLVFWIGDQAPGFVTGEADQPQAPVSPEAGTPTQPAQQ